MWIYEIDEFFRAFLETELNYEQTQKSSFLVSAGYELDTPINHLDDALNTGKG